MNKDDLTVAILRRRGDNLEETLKHIIDLPVDLLVVSDPYDMCDKEEAKIRVVTRPWPHDFSRARNEIHSLSTGKWILHLDTDESLDPTSFPILEECISSEPAIIKVSLLKSGARVLLPRLVPREARWHRPSHEIPIFDGPIRIEQRILIRHRDLSREEEGERVLYNVQLLEKEFERTKDPDLLFLCAVDYSFLEDDRGYYYANRFLQEFGSGSSEKTRMQSLMMEYAIAYIDGMSKKDIPKAIRRVRRLIAKRMDLSELWCLLGDLYFLLSSPTQAREMYENALVIGETVDFLDEDRMWADMTKYGDYPRARIYQCDELIQSGKLGRMA